MHSLLTSAFPAKYSTRSNVQYEVEAFHRVVNDTTSSFALSDEVESMLVDPAEGIWCCTNTSETDIHVINYEQYINQYRKGEASTSKRCDFVLYDAGQSHFVVAELTHCKQDSLTRPVSERTSLSKEEYTRLKFQDTIRILCAVSEINSFIKNHPIKSCVFACRLKDDQQTIDTVSHSMDGFQAVVQEVGTITHNEPLVIKEMSFRYTRCIHPDPYIF